MPSFDDPFESALLSVSFSSLSGGFCTIPVDVVQYPETQVKLKVKKDGVVQKVTNTLKAKQWVLDLNCFKFRFGRVFINDREDGGFTVTCKKGSITRYSLTMRVKDNKFYWYTWKNGHIRSYALPIEKLTLWVYKSLGLTSDPTYELKRLRAAVTLKMYKLACTQMPWVIDNVLDRINKNKNSVGEYDELYLERVLFLGMVYPNCFNLVTSYATYLYLQDSPVDKIIPQLRGSARDAAAYLCGQRSAAAIEKLNDGTLVYYPSLKEYLTPEQFMTLRIRKNFYNSRIVKPSPYPNINKAIGKMFVDYCAGDLEGEKFGGAYSCLSDMSTSLIRLHEIGYDEKLLTKLRRACKSIHQFDSALGEVLVKSMTKYYKYLNPLRVKVGNDLLLVTPSDSDELGSWGRQLHNCIGSYIRRYNHGEVLLLGLLEKGQCKAAIEIQVKYQRYLELHDRNSVELIIIQCEGLSRDYEELLKKLTNEAIADGTVTTSGIENTFRFKVGPEQEESAITQQTHVNIIAKLVAFIKKENKRGETSSSLVRF